MHPRPRLRSNGRFIDYEPTPAEARYLRRVEAAAADPAVKETELRGIIFGPDSTTFQYAA